MRTKPCDPFSICPAKDPEYTKEKPQASPWDSVVEGCTRAMKGLCIWDENPVVLPRLFDEVVSKVYKKQIVSF